MDPQGAARLLAAAWGGNDDERAAGFLPRADEAGGLSGRPLRERATAVVATLAKALDRALPIIGVGGIFSGDDAREKIEAGAALVQLYTGLIYRGPALVDECVQAVNEFPAIASGPPRSARSPRSKSPR